MSLKIVFTGLCVFVRLSSERVRVLIPNFNQPALIHGVPVSPHVAFMSWRRGHEGIKGVPSVWEPARPPHFAVFSRTMPESVDVYLLDGEAITIEKDPPLAAEPVEFVPHGIVEIERVIANGRIDAPFIADTYDPRPERVAAFFDVTIGRIEPISVERTLEFQPRLNEQSPYSGPFAEEVMWVLPRNHYVLKSRTIGPRVGRSQFAIDAENYEVVIRVGNVPLEDLVDPDSPRIMARDEELIDHHFHRYYEMCAMHPEVHPLPHRVSARTGALRPLGGNCPPAVFLK